MNKEEILNKYIDLIDKGYCCACNELNCIDNFPHAKIAHAIRELQQENKKYKEVIDKLKNKTKENIELKTKERPYIDMINKLKSENRILKIQNTKLKKKIEILGGKE